MAAKNDIRITELKDTLNRLNTTIDNQSDLIRSLQKSVEEANKQNQQKDQIISDLRSELAFLKNKLFGSTSEPSKCQIDGQLDLFHPVSEEESAKEEEKPAEVIEPELIEVSGYQRPKKSKATYDEIFANLPTREVIVDDTLTDEQKTCPACGKAMEPIGHEVIRTELQYTPAKLERIIYKGTTWACPDCKTTDDSEFVKDTGNNPALIEGSYVSSGLAAHVMYAKYVLGMPLYRLEQDFQRLGAAIPRTTMANWIITCSRNYLNPVYDYFKRRLLQRKYLMADETPLQVLKEEDRRPQSKSYVWLVRTGEDGDVPVILYKYTQTRAKYNIKDFLKDKEDDFYIMVDGYQGYNNLPHAKRCCCYAHLRRYFYRAIPKGHANDLNEPAVQAVAYCDKLFRYEAIYKAKGYKAKQIKAKREKDEKPILESFLSWADKQQTKANDQFAKALTYLNGCRPYMMNYLEDGNCSLSNNLSENSIRTVVVGRKAWLFSDTPDGANASMTIFSIVETAKANGLDPQKYLNYLLDVRPDAKMSDEDFEKIAPWNKEVQEKCK